MAARNGFVLDPAFCRPTYDGRSFTAIPASIAGLLGAGGTPPLAAVLGPLAGTYRSVVLFVVDAFGWRFIERFADHYPALRRFFTTGVAARLTSQFPSTTAAHITCLHTGLDAGQSGVYEWQYYEPQLDAVITPLLFSYAGSQDRDQLKAANVDPRSLYPTHTLYPGLAAQGIASSIFQHKEFTPSTYSDIVMAGATQVVPYRTFPEALVNLRALMTRQTGQAYYVLYFGTLDSIGHEYGPNSAQHDAECDAFLTSLERLFLDRLDGGAGQGLFMLTADHGLVETDPATAIYLNTDRRFAGIERYLKTDRAGHTLVPGGSCRDVFLYVKDDLLAEAQDFLAERLAGHAVVYRTADLSAAGFFGPRPPSSAFLARAGNLVILPYRGEAVWWYEKGKFEQKYYGHHGGLTPQEMEIPLLACRF